MKYEKTAAQVTLLEAIFNKSLIRSNIKRAFKKRHKPDVDDQWIGLLPSASVIVNLTPLWRSI